MKSRPDILEELDIKCGQLSTGRSPLIHVDTLWSTLTIMVKGAHLYGFVCMVFMTIAPFIRGHETQIKTNIFNSNEFGTYSFEYETSDGTYRREDGGIVSGPNGDSLVVRGEYGYIDPRGDRYSIKYVADINGYQPQLNEDDTRYNDRRII